ncbi:hypothetical protein [Streptomyces sp. WAC01280]|uniref:hypothetical protein n=1 Tax=Streptomyces sp. WAC01280 TaxID=2487424 RepID=UPI000F789645|nr:hypothetical protein [Streptomyces sp. WAC01280]RSS59781.1 hypothetical protein EF909_07935 [Streptomyces sp. WAC01280]
MAERLTFVLEGRDNLSRVLGHAGESAERLRRSMEDASDGSGRAMLTLTRDADGRLRDLEGRFISTADAAALMATRTGESARPVADWSRAADQASRAGEQLRSSLLTLAPAAIPMAAAIAPLAASTLAAGVGLAALGLATGRQVAAMSEAAKAEQKYSDAVEESGKNSATAVKAQAAYAKQMAKLPPETRRAAAALSVFKGEFEDWSDSLAKDTTAPLVKGLGVVQGIFPKLTPTVKGSAAQLDRLLTLAGGGVASPGFDGFMAKVDKWSTGALTRANDVLVHLLRTVDRPAVSGGIGDFMAWAREQGPAVSATLRDLGRALMNLLDAGSDVGVGMLTVVQALSHLVAAVPPEAITMMLQLAIAIKATAIAMAALGAARAFMAAFTAQLATMGAASGATTGRMAALTASFGAMSRGAKAALVGSGIGLLVIALSELSQMGKRAPADIDQMTGSIRNLGHTGLLSGEAARVMGSDFGELEKSLRTLARPSNLDATQQWLTQLIGMDSTPVSEAKDTLDALDQSLANLVRSGNAQAAADALKVAAANIGNLTADELRTQMDGYRQALDDVEFEQQMAAAAMGLFGQQALATKSKLDAQKMSADGLRQAITALNDVNRAGISAQIGFEQALDAAAEAAKKNAGIWQANGGTLDLNTEKGRTAASALNDLAAKTDAAASAARESGASWSTVNGIYDRGRQQLIANARQMGLSETAARNLANQILKTPDKTARLRGNLEDLQAKLADAKRRLASVPDSKRAAIRAEISQLQAQVARAKGAIGSVQGKTVSVMVQYRASHSSASDFTKSIGGYAGGGTPQAGEWAWVGEEGPELVQFKGSGARVYDHRTSMGMAGQVGAGQDAGAGLMAGMLGSRSGVEQAARGMAAGVEAGIRAELQIASPSKKTKKLMGHVSDGMAQGMATAGAKLRTQTKALMKDLQDGIVRGLTGSKSQIQATAADLNRDIWAAWARHPSTQDSALVKLVNREHDKLQKLASKRDALAKRLASARNLLKSRIEEQANYRAGVKSTAQGAASLSSLGLEQKEVTPGSIRAGLAQKLVKLRQFNRYITALTKRGLNKNLLRQLLAMGPEEGFAYAAALAGMTAADFKSVNSVQSQIDTEADSLGRHGAKTLYDAGVNSAKGLVAGLQSEQKAIEQQMVQIAKGMERAIKKALGIKSPSRVGIGIGGNFGRSVGDGALAELPYVGRAVDAVAGRMAGMRPMPGLPAAGLGVSASAGGGSPVYITVQGAIDPVSTAKQLQKVLVTLKRTNGGGELKLA